MKPKTKIDKNMPISQKLEALATMLEEEEMDVGMMGEEERLMYDDMDEDNQMMYSKMSDDDREKYRGMEDADRMNTMAKIKKAADDEDEKKKDDEVEKAEDATTASDSAEDRLDDLDEVQVQNVDEVAKAIASAIGKTKGDGQTALLRLQKSLQAQTVQKQQAAQSAKVEKVADVMVLMTETFETRFATIEKALENFAAAIGIKDEVMKAIKTPEKKVEKSDTDSTDSLVRTIVKAVREVDGLNPGEEKVVEKTINDDPAAFAKALAQVAKVSKNQDL